SSTATILFGVLAGQLLRSGLAALNKVALLILGGLVGLASGWALAGGGDAIKLDLPETIPMVKRLWTASFTLYAAGWTCLMLAAFYLVIDVLALRAWSFPFVVVGMNSIFMYVLAQLESGRIRRAWNIFLGDALDDWPKARPVILAALVMLV